MLVYCWPCICGQDSLTHPIVWMHTAALQSSLAVICEAIFTPSCSPVSLASHVHKVRSGSGTALTPCKLGLFTYDSIFAHEDQQPQIMLIDCKFCFAPHCQLWFAGVTSKVLCERAGSVRGVTNHASYPMINSALALFPPRHTPGRLHAPLSTKVSKREG